MGPLHVLQEKCLFVFSIIAILNRCEVILYCDFECIFAIISDVEQFFMYLWAICISSGKISISDLCPFFWDIIYLFLERREGRVREREKNNVREKLESAASCTHPNLGQNPQPRHVPWPGIEQVTFCFAGQHSTNWATLVRASWVSCVSSMELYEFLVYSGY